MPSFVVENFIDLIQLEDAEAKGYFVSSSVNEILKSYSLLESDVL